MTGACSTGILLSPIGEFVSSAHVLQKCDFCAHADAIHASANRPLKLARNGADLVGSFRINQSRAQPGDLIVHLGSRSGHNRRTPYHLPPQLWFHSSGGGLPGGMVATGPCRVEGFSALYARSLLQEGTGLVSQNLNAVVKGGANLGAEEVKLRTIVAGEEPL